MSSYTPKHSIQDAIRRRVAKNQRLKEKRAGTIDPETYLEATLERFNAAYTKMSNDVERYWLLEDLPRQIVEDLKQVDPGMEIDLNWRGEESETLVLESVTLRWSDRVREEKGWPEVTHVDVMSKILREMFMVV